ncbi:MAG TPA: hypothetical protein VEI96_10615 [Thermodesulfovibrionales bacterium]|nr:hypothetical protein [Thermodesulfovibrionales bacterium]
MADLETRELKDEDLDLIEAEFVTIRQSSVRSVEGGHVELQQVGALSIDGERIEITQSASTLVHGGDIHFNQSMGLITVGNSLNLQYSFSPISVSKDYTVVNRSAVGLLGARDVKAENTSAVVMIAGRVEGEVTTLLDWRSALAFGAVLGGALGLIALFKKQ